MCFARSLGCGFVVLLALWPLASLKLHAVELGPIAQPLLSAAARQRLTALATRYVAEGRVPGLHLMVRPSYYDDIKKNVTVAAPVIAANATANVTANSTALTVVNKTLS